LPAPLGDALEIAPAKLRDFSAEALTMALPPLKLAAAWGGQVLRASGRIAKAATDAARTPAPKEASKATAGKSLSKRPASKARTRQARAKS
jgi:hypothetical protein